MRSTFKIFFYINRSKTKVDGTTTILRCITIDGANSVITTGESIRPEEWHSKRGESTDKRTNQRLQTFREKIEQCYQTVLYKFGAVSAELLKNHLQGIGEHPTTLLALSAEELRQQQICKKEGVLRNNRCADRQLRAFVQKRDEEDLPLTALTMAFFDDYRCYLKKEEYAPSTVNRYLCWLSHLMYRAVSHQTIRFNPFEEAKYEAVEKKPRFLQKSEVAKLMALRLPNEEAELCRRMFLFSVFTGLSFADLLSLEWSHVDTNGRDQRYIRKKRQKTDVECVIPLHPIAEQISALYGGGGDEERSGDANTNESERKPTGKVFSVTQSQKRLRDNLKAIGLACGIRIPLTYHVGRHSFGTLTLEAGVPIESIAKMMGHASIASTQIYAQITDSKISRDMDRLIERSVYS